MASSYTVTRTRTVQAPPDRVYALIENFQHWSRWSPWEDLDPGMQKGYSGPDSGVGASYAWSGNRKAGEGRMEIVGAEPDRSVEIKLDFAKPFKSSNLTRFDLVPQGEATEVTWTMNGPRPLIMRLMGPLLNMEKLVGRDFDKGLERLDQVAQPKDAG